MRGRRRGSRPGVGIHTGQDIGIERALIELESDIPVKHVSCVHMCHRVPVLEIVDEFIEAAQRLGSMME